MAVIKSALGDISGRVGDLIFRKVRGKVIVTKVPAHHKIPMSAIAIEHRNRFQTTSRFVKGFCASALLKGVWSSAKLKGTVAFQKAVGVNYYLVNNLNLTVNNVITPDEDNSPPIKKMSIMGNRCIIEIAADQNFDKKATLIVVAGLMDPVNKALPNCQSFVVFEGNIDQELKIFAELDEEKVRLCSQYGRYILYGAMVRQKGPDLFEYTKTFAYEGKC